MEVKEEVEILSSVTKESLSEKVPLRKWARESCRFLQRDPPGRGGSQTCSAACCSVTKAGLALCDPMGCSKAGTSVRGIFQVRILEQADFLGQGMFPTQGSNRHLLHLLHGRVDSLPLAPPRKTICHNIIIYILSTRNMFLKVQVRYGQKLAHSTSFHISDEH